MKTYLSAQSLLEDSYKLADTIYRDGFEPTMIVALWRGGVPIGIAVQEYFAYQGVHSDHIAIRTSSYEGIDGRSDQVQVHGLSYLVETCTHSDRLLIVDDVFDTGRTLEAVIGELKAKARANTPEQIKVAVPYYKPARRLTQIQPDYFLHTTEEWLKYPHSLEGLSIDEVATHRPELYKIIESCLPK